MFILQTRPSHQMMSMWRPLCVRSQTYRKMSKVTFSYRRVFLINYKFIMLLSGGDMFLKQVNPWNGGLEWLVLLSW